MLLQGQVAAPQPVNGRVAQRERQGNLQGVKQSEMGKSRAHRCIHAGVLHFLAGKEDVRQFAQAGMAIGERDYSGTASASRKNFWHASLATCPEAPRPAKAI